MDAPTTDSSATADAAWIGVTGLQCELRGLFSTMPTHRALRAALRCIAQGLGARYAVVHARFGAQPLSEEWVRQGAPVDDRLRHTVNHAMWDAISADNAKCVRGALQSSAIATALMYDQDAEQSGAAAMVFDDAGQAHDLRILAQFESMVGYLALLVSGRQARLRGAPRWADSDLADNSAQVARHPMQLAFTVAADLKNRHGFNLTAIGFAHRHRIKIAAVCGLNDVRGANPGVQLMRAAMEECLDRSAAVFWGVAKEPAESEHARDDRLHRQWSQALGGKSVASFPLALQGEVVAVVSVSHGMESGLSPARIQEIAQSPEMVLYGALVPLSRSAARGLCAHAADIVRDTWARLTGRSRRRAAVLLTAAAALLAWFVFGTLPYGFAVPCVVKADDRRVVSCPRDGVLADLYVQPGDIVREGQLLATLDAHDDMLRKLHLEAQVHELDAEADAALAERDFARIRVLEAQKATLRAQLAAVESSIEQAEIRAPQASVVFNGDLREQVGSRVTRGDPMFDLARYDRTVVTLKIPESRLLAARASVAVAFSPAAQPDARLALHDVRIAPASTVADGQNVFLGDALVEVSIEGLAPGMEGVAHVDVGPRPVWWVLSNRCVSWLRLNFWL